MMGCCWSSGWTHNFLEVQGFEVHDNVVFQDNQSTILLAKNGRASSGCRTRHINIWYFFVSDHIAREELRVKYCPMGDMMADFFTKPLQGSLFVSCIKSYSTYLMISSWIT
jgi:hypothetical protein